MKLTRPLIPDHLRRAAHPAELRLNHGGELYANPRATADLDAAGHSHNDAAILFDELTATTVALHWVPRGTTGSSRVRRPKPGNTAIFSASPLLLLHPRLRVQQGRIRCIPYHIDLTEDGPLFVLDINDDQNVPSGHKSTPEAKTQHSPG